MTPETLTDPDLDLREVFEGQLLDPKDHGKLGAHVGGGNPLIPLLRDFVRGDAAYQVPRAVHRSYRGWKYGMLANDRLGDCVVAAIYHAIMHALKGVGRPVPDPDTLTEMVVQVYSAIGGYDPADQSTDQGLDPAEAWAYWQRQGVPFGDGTHKIAGAVQILPHDGVNLRRAIYEFDGAGLSLALPVAWQGAAVWDVGGDPLRDPDWQPGGWGGHEVLGVSYDARQIAVITWGAPKLMTWRAWGTYGQLALASVSTDQIGAGGLSETGIDLSALERDLPQL